MYTIQVMHFGVIFPVIYTLMDGKTNEKYQMMFDLLVKAVGSDFMDRNFTFMGDFEIAHFNFLSEKCQEKTVCFTIASAFTENANIFPKLSMKIKHRFMS